MAEVDLVFDPISSPVEAILFSFNCCLLMCIVTVVTIVLIDLGED